MSEPLLPPEQSHSNGLLRGWHKMKGLAIAPRQTMLQTALDGEFWLPILIVAIAMAGLRLTMVPQIRQEYNKPEVREQYQTQRKITAEAADKELQIVSTALPALMVLEAPLMVLTGVTAIAFLLQLITRFKFKKPVPFRQMFAFVAWGTVVGAIPLLLNLTLSFVGPELTLPSSPAVLLPKSLAGGYFYNVLLSLDIFMIAQVCLISLGIAELCAVSLQRAAGAVGTLFVIFVVLNSLIASSPK